NSTKLRAWLVQNLCDQFTFAKDYPSAFFQPATRTDQCFPTFIVNFTHEEDLNVSARLFTTPNQAGGNHARIIYDHDIVWVKKSSEIPEARIRPGFFATIEHQHARSVSLVERCLRDEIIGKIVIKI